MIAQLRQLAFWLFRKAVPMPMIERAIHEERRRLGAASCLLGPHSIIHQDARIINLSGQRDRIAIGAHCLIRGELLVNSYGGAIRIGNYSSIGEGSRVWSSSDVRIGSRVHISHNVNIMDGNTHSLDCETRHGEYLEILAAGSIQRGSDIDTMPVAIGDSAWISFNVTILKGVNIGAGAVIGANSLVLQDVPANTLAAGSPAVVIRELKAGQPRLQQTTDARRDGGAG
jgi:acetyltransferase-like isoleucine patch superfamily enzyme